MGIPCSLDPLGSGNAEPYKKGQILVEIANPQTTAEQVIDIPKPGFISFGWSAAAIRPAGAISAATARGRRPALLPKCILMPNAA